MARTSLGRKALSILLAATMVVSLNVPVCAWATTDGGGSQGTESVNESTDQNLNSSNSDEQDATDGDGESSDDAAGQSDESEGQETSVQTASTDKVSSQSIDFDSFLDLLTVGENGVVSFDGSTATSTSAVVDGKLQVKWSPVSGCFWGTQSHDGCKASGVAATGNTPNRINSHNAQYQVLKDATDVTIKNVKFVYETADFNICANSDWATTTTAKASDAPNAQFFLLNTGSLTVENCSFDHVVLTGWQNAGATTVTGCSFSNAYNSYAMKDMGGSTLKVSNCSFENCSGAVMTNSNKDRTVSSSVTITNNKFTSIDVDGTAPNTETNKKVGTRGVIQIADQGDYSSTTFDFSGNTNNGCGPIIRQLSKTVKLTAQNVADLNALAGSGSLTTSDSNEISADVTGVATMGETTYGTVQEAINTATDAATVTLIDDTTVTDTVTVASDKNITLDLNGKTITNNSGNAVEVAGNLVVKDSTATQPTVNGATVSDYRGGAIVATGKESVALRAEDGGTVTLESGKVQSEKHNAVSAVGNSAPGNDSPVKSTVTINGGYVLSQEFAVWVGGNGAVANVNGGVLEAKDNTVVGGNGTANEKTNYGGTVINISGGQLVGHIQSSGYIACGVYHPQAGTLNITGGSIYADGGVGVLMRAGTANITGGTIQTTGSTDVSGKVGDSGIISHCYGVFVEGKSAYPGAKAGGLSASVSGDAQVITESTDVPVLNRYDWEGSGVTSSLETTGGTFSNDPSAYVAEGYEATVVDGKYVVAPVVVAQVGDNSYSTLQAAIDAAADGATVRLCGDTDENVTIGKNLTLDLNGHTINGGTVASKATLYITGDVTIEDTSAAQTGTIKREDTDQSKPYYVIDIQENANVTFKSGNVINDSGILTPRSGTSLVRIGDDDKEYNPVLNIDGGTFKQDNFVTIKNDYGTLNVNGGTITSANDEAIKNWRDTNIQGGTVNGTIGSWVWSKSKADASLVISKGATVNGNVFGMEYNTNYASSTITSFPKSNAVSIQGGSVNGNLGIYQGSDIRNKAVVSSSNFSSIAVEGGTFSINPSAYVTGNYAAVLGGDGKYVVGAKSDSGSISDASGNSGTTKAEGATVSNSDQLAGDALKVAEDVTKVEVPTFDSTATDTTTKETTIGGSKVEVTKAQAEALEQVKTAAADSNASVEVELAVKADTSTQTVDDKISEQATNIGATATPFKLSVEMVTTVKKSGSSDVKATVPVVEAASAIQVTITVDANTIKDKRVSVARSHNGVVDILDADVNYETGAVTFSTDKFSDYAVLTVDANKAYQLSDYTSEGARVPIDPAKFNYSSEYAFAGWYTDEDCTTAVSKSATSGTVYPKFVKISDLITFKGGSLRMDKEASVGTSLRFGYETSVPSGASLESVSWDYNVKESANVYKLDMKNYIVNENSITANIVLTGLDKADYQTVYCAQETVVYTTADGTRVAAKEASANDRSVVVVAHSIVSNGNAPAADKTYANAILSAI